MTIHKRSVNADKSVVIVFSCKFLLLCWNWFSLFDVGHILCIGIRKFQCRLCNYKGVTQSDLNRHAKSQIHMLKARNQCESCGEGFVSPINLGKHFHERHFGQTAVVNSDLDHRQWTSFFWHFAVKPLVLSVVFGVNILHTTCKSDFLLSVVYEFFQFDFFIQRELLHFLDSVFCLIQHLFQVFCCLFVI